MVGDQYKNSTSCHELREFRPMEKNGESNGLSRHYDDLTSGVRDLGDGITRRGRAKAGAFIRKICNVTNNSSLIKNLFPKVFEPYGAADFLCRHAANVTIIVLNIADAMGLDDDLRLDAALAAAAHEMGMFALPPELVLKKGPLTHKEMDALHNHPNIGRSLLSSAGDRAEAVARIVYQEHERENGSGYPEGVKGGKISRAAKIIAVADTFEAMIHNRPHRGGESPFSALQKLTIKMADSYCPEVLKTFASLTTPFPPTTCVRLNDDRIGRVVEVNRRHPLRPRLQLFNASEMKKEILDLRKTPSINIVGVMEKEKNCSPG